MINKLLKYFMGGLVFGAAVIFVCPEAAAQAAPDQNKKNEEALQIVRSQPISSVFYDALITKVPSQSTALILTKAFIAEHRPGESAFRVGDFEKWYMMDFEDGKNRIRISINEYESPELAVKVFNTDGYSYGIVTGGKEFGDATVKGFNMSGEFVGLKFRKNRFVVYISGRSEATVKAFAESARQSIEAK